MELQSAAKINLFLKVAGKRADGYHDLVSVMQSVSLCDRLTIEFERRDFYIAGNMEMGPADQNLVSRVWRLMKARYRLPGELQVYINKRIPLGAGLAGGSGNGAAVLRAIDRYFDLALKRETMQELALSIGSDLPFCLFGGTALVTGKGGDIQPLPSLREVAVIIVTSDFAVSTAACFQAYDAGRLADSTAVEPLITALQKGNWTPLPPLLHNGLERVTLAKYPQLVAVKEELAGYGLTPLMSGSGPTIFALADPSTAHDIDRYYQPANGRLLVTRPLSAGILFSNTSTQ